MEIQHISVQEINSLETLTCSVITERFDIDTEEFFNFEEMSYWAKGSLKWAIRKAVSVEGNINVYSGVTLYCTLKLVH